MVLNMVTGVWWWTLCHRYHHQQLLAATESDMANVNATAIVVAVVLSLEHQLQ